MIFLVALLASILFGVCIFALLHSRQTPEAQLRKRLNEMIHAAETERAKSPKLKKNLRRN